MRAHTLAMLRYSLSVAGGSVESASTPVDTQGSVQEQLQSVATALQAVRSESGARMTTHLGTGAANDVSSHTRRISIGTAAAAAKDDHIDMDDDLEEDGDDGARTDESERETKKVKLQ